MKNPAGPVIDVVAAIIEQQGKILLARRDNHSDQAGLWEFPGGKVEAGESQPQALARELAEELAIIARIGRYIACERRELNGKTLVLHAWHVPEFSGAPTLHCHSEFCWVTPQAAAAYPLAAADVPLLRAFIASK